MSVVFIKKIFFVVIERAKTASESDPLARIEPQKLDENEGTTMMMPQHHQNPMKRLSLSLYLWNRRAPTWRNLNSQMNS
ncbi:unnamed protein product [Brassica oleracea]